MAQLTMAMSPLVLGEKQVKASKTFQILWSHKRDNWKTNTKRWRQLDGEFHFKLDAATEWYNPLGTPHFYYYRADALRNFYDGLQPYNPWYDVTFINPPFSQTPLWVERAYDERFNGITTVALLPARTGTKWWHTYVCSCRGEPLPDNSTCTGYAPWVTVRMHDKREKFDDGDNSAPFDTCVVIFGKVAAA